MTKIKKIDRRFFRHLRCHRHLWMSRTRKRFKDTGVIVTLKVRIVHHDFRLIAMIVSLPEGGFNKGKI